MNRVHLIRFRKLQVYFVFALMLMMGGCMLGPNFQQAEYSGPANFRFDSSATKQTVNLRWWELWDDPVLDTLIVTALNENKDVLIAARRVESARINMGYVAADQWPAFHYSADMSAQGLSGSSAATFNTFPQFSWEIGFWGKYRRMNEAAQAEFLSSQYAQRMVQLGLITSVASTYYSILASKAQLEIARRTLIARDSSLNIMFDKYKGGMISLMDYNQAKIQRDIAAVTVPVYERAVLLATNSLNILLGHYPVNIELNRSFGDVNYELEIPVGIPSELLKRRPDVLMAEANWHAQTANIGVAEALRWPSFSLTGLGGASVDLLTFNTVGLTWSAGANLFGPLFQFGKNKKRVELARQAAETALLDYESTAIRAFKDVEDALVNIRSFKDELKAQESRVMTAISSEELSYVRYGEGTTTYLEVLEQQRAAFSAQLDVLKTRFNLLNSYIMLYKALGGGWLSPEEEQEYMQQNK